MEASRLRMASRFRCRAVMHRSVPPVLLNQIMVLVQDLILEGANDASSAVDKAALWRGPSYCGGSGSVGVGCPILCCRRHHATPGQRRLSGPPAKTGASPESEVGAGRSTFVATHEPKQVLGL
eukprot:2769094-Amphidinium_carterae.1